MGKRRMAIIMGSKSDLPVMQHGADILKRFHILYEVKILSAHRTPKQTIAFAQSAQRAGYKVIIAAAGGAAHLAGIVAAHTTLPVIGVPMETQSLGGIDSLLSIVQMPSGVPVGCMAIGKAGAVNAALFAVQILAVDDIKLQIELIKYKKQMASAVLKK